MQSAHGELSSYEQPCGEDPPYCEQQEHIVQAAVEQWRGVSGVYEHSEQHAAAAAAVAAPAIAAVPVAHDGGDDLPEEMVYDQTAEVRAVLSLVRHNRLAKVQAVLDDGWDVETRDAFGNSLLLVAAQNNLRRMAKLLLEQGADVHGRNGKGNTCLHFAYAYQFPKMITLLKAAGADESVTNRMGLRCPQGIDAAKGRQSMYDRGLI